MAMRKNQPKVQAIDLWVSGMMGSASFRPGEKRAISGAGTCGSMGTAMASARNLAVTASPASKRKRNNVGSGIAADSSRKHSRDHLHLPLGKQRGHSRN